MCSVTCVLMISTSRLHEKSYYCWFVYVVQKYYAHMLWTVDFSVILELFLMLTICCTTLIFTPNHVEVVEHACGMGTLQMGEYVSNVSNGIDTFSIREPLGVCAGICPFNFPAMIPLWVCWPNLFFPVIFICNRKLAPKTIWSMWWLYTLHSYLNLPMLFSWSNYSWHFFVISAAILLDWNSST